MPDSLIAPDTELEGNLHAKGTLVVRGHFKGEITAGHAVQVDAEGLVQGTVTGTNVLVDGDLEGQIAARKALQFGENCHVRATLINQPEMVIVHEKADLGKSDDD